MLGCVSFTSPITFEAVGQFHPNLFQIQLSYFMKIGSCVELRDSVNVPKAVI